MEGDGWQKSSYSNPSGNCVEVNDWRKSTSSLPNGACVEVAFTGENEVLVRDTKDKGEGPILRFTGPEWDAFVAGVKDSEFDVA